MFESYRESISEFFKFRDIQKKKNEIIFYSEGSHDSIYFQDNLCKQACD